MGYSSVEAMNKDDKEAEMYKTLTEGTYPPDEISSYDIEQGEQKEQTIITRSAMEVEEK